MRRTRSVTASVVAGFGLCLLALGVLMASAMSSAYDSERERAEAALDATARSSGFEIDVEGGVLSALQNLAATPGMTGFDPAACAATLEPLGSLGTTARAVAVAPDGSLVCSVPPRQPGHGLPDDVLDQALSGTAYQGDVLIDGLLGGPAIVYAAPIAGMAGVGALVAVLPTGDPPLQVPPAVDARTAVLVVDPTREVILATTTSSPYRLGSSLAGTGLADSIGRSTVTIADPDGVRRLWREAIDPGTGWVVLAGLEVDVALAGAHEQRRSLLVIGAAVLALVVVLAIALQRRLARPVRKLGDAIAASKAGDRDARAPLDGPTELAEVASAFNELVDAQQAMEDRLREWATHDTLTGLPNRRAATEALDAALLDPTAVPVAVLFIDLDRFKLVNDSHGHAVGDELLVELSGRLQAAAPSDWLVSRFGGDEFVVVCPRCIDPEPVADRISALLRSTIRVDGHELVVGGSIGIAVARPGEEADDLLREADTAMYRAKESGRGGHALFDDEMRAWTVSRLTTERDLRGATDRGELLLHFQPVFDLATGEASGAEALIRWQHPERGLLGPLQFVSIAEETDLITPIGRWVLEQAARQAVAWREQLGRRMPVSVNIAACQLADGGLLDAVTAALAAARAEPADLCLEVTESAVLADVDMTIELLDALRRLGVRVSIDDFGTGYSSLAYLQRLPADELKIDRAFVAEVGRDPVSTTIVSSIVDLAHAVGLSVVAEGVEEPGQLEVLGRLGCDRAQGFLLARPAPAADLSVDAWCTGLFDAAT